MDHEYLHLFTCRCHVSSYNPILVYSVPVLSEMYSCLNRRLMLCMLGKNFSWQHMTNWLCFCLSPQNRFWHFMQIVSIGDNLHEMSKPVLLETIYVNCQILFSGENMNNIISLSSAEFAQRVIKIKLTVQKMVLAYICVELVFPSDHCQ